MSLNLLEHKHFLMLTNSDIVSSS